MRVVPRFAAAPAPITDLAVMPTGANVPMLVVDQDGRRWVCKDVDGGRFTTERLFGEALAYLLARTLGVPVPDGAIAHRARGRAWMSALIDNALPWTSALPVPAWQDLGRILALDVLLLNIDRNPHNLLLQLSPPRAWAIDHELIGAASLSRLRSHSLTPLQELPRFEDPGSQPRQLPLDELRAHACRLADEAARLEPAFLEAIITAAAAEAGLTSPHLAEHARLLCARARQAPELVRRYIEWRKAR